MKYTGFHYSGLRKVVSYHKIGPYVFCLKDLLHDRYFEYLEIKTKQKWAIDILEFTHDQTRIFKSIYRSMAICYMVE